MRRLQEGRAPRQEPLDPRPDLLDVRPRRGGDGGVARHQVSRSCPTSRPPISRASRRAMPSARRPSCQRGALVYEIKPATFRPGLYRTVTGTEALAWGLVAGSQLAGLKLVFSSYPITPASSVLHVLSPAQGLRRGDLPGRGRDRRGRRRDRRLLRRRPRRHLKLRPRRRAQDGGSGPRDHRRAAADPDQFPTRRPVPQACRPRPSSRTSTSAVYGRNADAPLVVLAARSSAEAFDVAIEAVRLATRYMTPVVVLSDTFIANAAEPWRLPDVGTLEPFPVAFHTDAEGFQPYRRDAETLARRWVKPGTPGPRAPHWRAREGLHDGQRLLRP